jgi:hypothetical protein
MARKRHAQAPSAAGVAGSTGTCGTVGSVVTYQVFREPVQDRERG